MAEDTADVIHHDDGLVEVTFAKPCRFLDSAHKEHLYARGTQRVLPDVANHWWIKFHLVNAPAPRDPQPGTPAYVTQQLAEQARQRLAAQVRDATREPTVEGSAGGKAFIERMPAEAVSPPPETPVAAKKAGK